MQNREGSFYRAGRRLLVNLTHGWHAIGTLNRENAPVSSQGVPASAPRGRPRQGGPAAPPARRSVFRCRAGFRLRVAVVPAFEELENLTLLSASITGTVWGDPAGIGVRRTGAPGVAGETVFLDLGGNHQDRAVTTVAAPSNAIVPATGQLGGIAAGAGVSTLQVAGLPATLTGLKVTMDLANNGTSPVTVGVISPVGQTVSNFPTLFQIQPGEHFVGSFDPGAATPVTLARRPLAPGTYAPEQFFGDPQAHVLGTDPNGDWGLVFVGDRSGLVLSGWSLALTTPDPATRTDALGGYRFTGLAAGPTRSRRSPRPARRRRARPAGRPGRSGSTTARPRPASISASRRLPAWRPGRSPWRPPRRVGGSRSRSTTV